MTATTSRKPPASRAARKPAQPTEAPAGPAPDPTDSVDLDRDAPDGRDEDGSPSAEPVEDPDAARRATADRVVERAQEAYDKVVERLRARYAELVKAKARRAALDPPAELTDGQVEVIANGGTTEEATVDPATPLALPAGVRVAVVRCTRSECVNLDRHTIDQHLDPADPLYSAELAHRLDQLDAENARAASKVAHPGDELPVGASVEIGGLTFTKHAADPFGRGDVTALVAGSSLDTAAYEAAMNAAKMAGEAKAYSLGGLPAEGQARVAAALGAAQSQPAAEPQPAADPVPAVEPPAAPVFPFAQMPAPAAFNPFANQS